MQTWAPAPVRSVWVFGDEREPHSRKRLHAKAAQDFHVAVPPAYQHKVLAQVHMLEFGLMKVYNTVKYVHRCNAGCLHMRQGDGTFSTTAGPMVSISAEDEAGSGARAFLCLYKDRLRSTGCIRWGHRSLLCLVQGVTCSARPPHTKHIDQLCTFCK